MGSGLSQWSPVSLCLVFNLFGDGPWPMASVIQGLAFGTPVSITALKKTNEKPSYALMPDQFVWRWHSGISLWNGHPRGWPRVALVNVHGAHDHCPSLHLRSSI